MRSVNRKLTIFDSFVVSIIIAVSFSAMLQACKKSDFATGQTSYNKEFTENFFIPKNGVQQKIQEVIQVLKHENGKRNFVDALPHDIGRPVWEKTLIRKVRNTLAKGDSNEHYFVIPFAPTGTYLIGLLIVIPHPDSTYTISYYGTEHLYQICHDANKDITKTENLLGIFMEMDNLLFGREDFYHIPRDLFTTNARIILTDSTKVASMKQAQSSECTGTNVPSGVHHPGEDGNCDWALGCPWCSGCYYGGNPPFPDPQAPGGGGGGGTPPSGPPSAPPTGGGGGGGTCTGCPPPSQCRVPFYVENPCDSLPPDRDAHGFLYSRIAELNYRLALNQNALLPCDSLNIMPLNPETGYGLMWQRVASFMPPPYIKQRIDSIINVIPAWGIDNFNYTTLTEAFGTSVNCDYFPVRITQLPTGFTAQSLIEYFRTHINSFIDNNIGVSFSPYTQDVVVGGNPVHFTDSVRFFSFQENSLGALIHLNMLDDGSVILSDYYHYMGAGEKHRFKYTTMATPLDTDHPVAGNREWGIFSKQSTPNEYTFYTMGVDRISDWIFAATSGGTSSFNLIFNNADKLWKNMQKNMILFINSSGGQASYYNQSSVVARPKWSEVGDFLLGLQDWDALMQKLGC